MIIYDETPAPDMLDYGISIPLSSTRKASILRFLEEHTSPIPRRTLGEAAAVFGLEDKTLITRQDLERVHDPAYIAKIYNDPPHKEGLLKVLMEAYELINDDGTYNRYEPEGATKPLTDLADSIIYHIAGTYLSLRVALEGRGEGPFKDFCFCLGGGAHHPRYDGPSGFGVLNDPVIAVRKIMAEGRASFIWIIDVDAHKGDGTAELIRFSRDQGKTFSGKNPEVFTLSVHMAAGWPLDRASLAKAQPGRAPLVDSDIDIPIAQGEEASYVPRLAEALEKMTALAGPRKPDLALVVDGVDVYEKDGLPSTSPIALTLEQILERDRFMLSFLEKQGIPSGWIMAGGYGKDSWEPTAAFLKSLSDQPIKL
jgi:acetoin utilization deacetylase AcuC-like enzyme